MNSLRFAACAIGLIAMFPANAQEPPPSRVVVAEITQQEIAATSRLVGIIDFDRVSKVSGEVSGLITEQHAREGLVVKAGEPLVTLNTDFIEKDMDIKRAQQAQFTADLQKLAATLKRLESLLQKKTASRQAYDDALYDHRSLAKKLETLDLELERLQLRITKSTVRAPFDGIVLEKLKESGEWLDPGIAVCTLASSNDLVVKAAISENMVRYQRPGESLAVTVNALDIQLQGTAQTISPVARQRSKSATLKVTVPYHPGMIRNMSATVEVPSGEAQHMLMLPRDALVRNGGANFVYTVGDGKARMVSVNVLTRRGDQAGVASPALKPGMKVVVDGNDRLQPDQPVMIVGE